MKYGRWWWCDTCDPEGKVTYARTTALKAHLRDVHGIEDTTGTRQMVAHLDEAQAYHSINLLTIGTVTIREETHTKRTGENKRQWRQG